MPEGAAGIDSDDEDHKKRVVDEDTKAIMGVDLTVDTEEGIPVVPVLGGPRLEVGVQRKK
ncbi:hypothetical protein HK097_002254, partial [Rhizophlyctis rosea]